LREEFPQRQVAETAARRGQRLAQRKEVLVGTNRYVNLEEERPSPPEIDYEAIYRERVTAVENYRQDNDWKPAAEGSLSALPDLITAAEAGATLGQLTAALRATGPGADYFTAQPVHWHRLAEPFEALRANADAYEEEHGRRPRVFLATMGPRRQHQARADFSRGFFQVGGFEIVYPDGFEAPEAAAEAALADEADVVVICSTDESYPEIAPTLVEEVRGERPFIPIILAGYPQEQVDAHRAAGVDEFIYLGADCLAINRWLQKKLM
jgi:methylmalonyl-CoA mutase